MKPQTRRFLSHLVVLGTAVLFSACTTLDIGRTPNFESKAKWALLPFVNHTETPQAGLRAESIADNLLRTAAISNIKRYPSNLNTETLFEPMDRKQFDAALEWARGENMKYALTGSVDEWRYKVGIDGEPAAGITLQVIDVESGDVLWSASGGSTGWSREALSAVAQKLMRKLLSPVVSAAS